jgi:hypothetical protein
MLLKLRKESPEAFLNKPIGASCKIVTLKKLKVRFKDTIFEPY